MRNREGFTLVELLVVIAIIAILAAIAIPRVSGFIGRSQMRAAEASVTSIDTAITGILSDAKTRDFRGVFTRPFLQGMATKYPLATTTGTGPTVAQSLSNFAGAVNVYTDVMYRLLRQGRTADFTGTQALQIAQTQDAGSTVVRQDVLNRLSPQYIDLQTDPWGSRFHFFVGPLLRNTLTPLRSYRQVGEQDGLRIPLFYDSAAKSQLEQDTVPGQPLADDGYGIPADYNTPVYVWSIGENVNNDQGYFEEVTPAPPEAAGGGDDIGNWDMGNSQKGWEVWY